MTSKERRVSLIPERDPFCCGKELPALTRVGLTMAWSANSSIVDERNMDNWHLTLITTRVTIPAFSGSNDAEDDTYPIEGAKRPNPRSAQVATSANHPLPVNIPTMTSAPRRCTGAIRPPVPSYGEVRLLSHRTSRRTNDTQPSPATATTTPAWLPLSTAPPSVGRTSPRRSTPTW
jgi:hypothetical protein